VEAIKMFFRLGKRTAVFLLAVGAAVDGGGHGRVRIELTQYSKLLSSERILRNYDSTKEVQTWTRRSGEGIHSLLCSAAPRGP
jgi:hypothetical protein